MPFLWVEKELTVTGMPMTRPILGDEVTLVVLEEVIVAVSSDLIEVTCEFCLINKTKVCVDLITVRQAYRHVASWISVFTVGRNARTLVRDAIVGRNLPHVGLLVDAYFRYGEREVDVVLAVRVDIVKHHQLEESLHIHHPCRDILSDTFRYILVTATILKIGAICLLVFYSLMNEDLRFSRAIVLLGSLWSIIATLGIRGLLGMLNVDGYQLRNGRSHKYTFVGSDEEALRLQNLFDSLGIEAKDTKIISPNNRCLLDNQLNTDEII